MRTKFLLKLPSLIATINLHRNPLQYFRNRFSPTAKISIKKFSPKRNSQLFTERANLIYFHRRDLIAFNWNSEKVAFEARSFAPGRAKIIKTFNPGAAENVEMLYDNSAPICCRANFQINFNSISSLGDGEFRSQTRRFRIPTRRVWRENRWKYRRRKSLGYANAQIGVFNFNLNAFRFEKKVIRRLHSS